MARRKTKTEIAAIVKAIDKQRAQGVPLTDCCNAQGVAPANYYRWAAAEAGEADETSRQLRELNKEVSRLRRAVADLMLDNQMLREVAKKKW
jgi:putative transposase